MFTMRRGNTSPVFAIILVFLMSMAGARAAFAPFTPYFGDLLTELTNRVNALTGTLTAQQKKDKNTYNSLIKTINKKSTSLTTDLKTAATVVKSIDKSFPLDAVLQTLEDELVANLEFELQGASNTLNIALLNLGGGKLKSSALQMLLGANDLVSQSLIVTKHADKIKKLDGAYALITKANKSIKNSAKIVTEGLTCHVNGFVFKGDSSSFTMSATTLSITAHQNSGPTSTIQMDYPISSPLVAGQAYTLAPGTATYTNNETNEIFTVEGGTISLLTLDAPTNAISGTFLFFASGPVTGSLNVSEGYFVSKALVVQ
ncbi:MAG: hypothetical protein HY286_19715 [Planctomycetes bacterium]|nr:hypothetical protein [Planctomycetota bacterium]